ncbi:hypothetical protein KC351_g650 [Hortaea werneckii]|nr:hypothetical protein KC351_g650 [Hortaea werneckii]
MGKSEHRHEPPKEQGRPAIVKIATVNGGHDIDTKRSGKGLFEFVDTLEVNDSGEAESKIQVGKWMWWRFAEAGKEDNNMGLPLAILHYKSGYCEVAVLRGVEVPEEGPSRRNGQTRVVCSADCWIIEVENIGSAVTEEETKGEGEGYGRVETRNSRGERFSLDRYHSLKRVGNPLEPENGPEVEPTANLDAAEQGAGPKAEWMQGQRQNVVPDVEQGTAPEAEPDAEREIESSSKSKAPLNAAETGETQVWKTSLVSALTPEAMSEDDDSDELMPLAGYRASNETETMNGVICANDMPAEAADESRSEQDREFRPTRLIHPKEPLSSILANASGSGFDLIDNDRQGNNVIDPSLLQDGHNTESGVESEKDPLLASALQSLEGDNEITTTAILTTLKALNIDPDTWIVVDPGLFERESPYLRGLQDTHRYLITVVNVGNHWTAAVIDRDSGQVDIYDPLQQEDTFRSAWSWPQPRFGLVDRHSPMEQNESPSWQPQNIQSQLRQRDASNCGVYATVYCIYRLHGLELPQNIYPSSWRRAFAGILAAPNSEERRRHLQRLKTHGLYESDAGSGIQPSRAETAIHKVIVMIREYHHQAEAKSRPMHNHALSMERQHEGVLAKGLM